jgi:hypothetical protein
MLEINVRKTGALVGEISQQTIFKSGFETVELAVLFRRNRLIRGVEYPDVLTIERVQTGWELKKTRPYP